jgi:peptide/nickel transport system substrate-binding protein
VKIRRHVARAVLTAVATVALCACGTTAVAPPPSAHALRGGTVTYAHDVGDDFTWLLPIVNSANDTTWNLETEALMWPPLYAPGRGSLPLLNDAQSLAYPPIWRDHDTEVLIRLKPLRWSTGAPVTTRDVEFWWNLYRDNKSQIATYIPGEIPDNVRTVRWLSPSEFLLVLTRSYNPLWYDLNELTLIVPLPQASWDKESASGPVGNFDMTAAGARAVFDFLVKQSESVSTYATNPMWQVVDGPWRLESYNPVTYETVLVRNDHYDGPGTPHLSKIVFESFASSTAEVDALRAGSLDYGFLPYSDLGLASYFRSHGYTIAPWYIQAINMGELNYTGPYSMFTKQLYIRQALQHLVDEPLYLSRTYFGYGYQQYGPVPNTPGSPYVSPEERTDPDPFSIAAAEKLLAAHGWRRGAGGVDVCERPGSGASDCGAGIAAGTPLKILFLYTSGYPSFAAQVQAFASAAARAGVDIVLDPQTETTVLSDGALCPPGPCDWGIVGYAYYFWAYSGSEALPVGGQVFGQGNYWGGGYYSPEAERLLDAVHDEPGLSHLFAWEDYISRQVAALWLPTGVARISVVKDTLKGWYPQSPYAYDPSNWYFVGGRS